MRSRLVLLGEADSFDPARVGAKASGLAHAAALGCPVLPGFVIPALEFSDLVLAASGRVSSEGVHAAQLEVSLAPLDPALLAEVRAAAGTLGEEFVCRSSSPAEGDLSFSGAFSSFVGVNVEELAIAVAGVAASVFGPEVEAALAGDDRSFPQVAPSVLIQRCLRPRVSGTARRTTEGEIQVVAVQGSPAPLLAGWASGSVALIGAEGRTTGAGVELTGAAVLSGIAGVFGLLAGGAGTVIEWAAEGEEVIVLQVGATSSRPARPKARRRERAPLAPDVAPLALAAARVVARCAGPFGEELLLPWSLAPGADVAPRACPEAPELELLARARALSRQLNGCALAGSGLEAAGLLEQLASRSAEEDLRRLAGLRPVEPELAAELLGVLLALEASLHRRGLLRASSRVPEVEPGALDAALAGGAATDLAASVSPLRRWQRLLQLALSSACEVLEAEAAAPGVVVGIGRQVAPHATGEQLGPGEIVLLDQPLSRFAPLMWRVAGMVCLSGNESSHLLEVARARRVPAVILHGLSAEQRRELDGALLLVEGDAGELRVAASTTGGSRPS